VQPSVDELIVITEFTDPFGTKLAATVSPSGDVKVGTYKNGSFSENAGKNYYLFAGEAREYVLGLDKVQEYLRTGVGEDTAFSEFDIRDSKIRVYENGFVEVVSGSIRKTPLLATLAGKSGRWDRSQNALRAASQEFYVMEEASVFGGGSVAFRKSGENTLEAGYIDNRGTFAKDNFLTLQIRTHGYNILSEFGAAAREAATHFGMTSPELEMENYYLESTEEDAVITSEEVTENFQKMMSKITGKDNADKTSLMKDPVTIGMVIKAEGDGDVERLLKENLADVWESLAGRGVEKRILLERGVKVGNITYVVYVDDGTIDALEGFNAALRAAGNGKGRTFAWVMNKDSERGEALAQLEQTAHVVALQGEYLPVSWQIAAGYVYANYIVTLNSVDRVKDYERINAVVADLVEVTSLMTKIDFDELDKSLGETLRNMDRDSLAKLFNGRNLILILPDIKPITGELAEAYKADRACQRSL